MMIEHDSQFRNSRMEYDKVYFWTDTIKDWNPILSQDKYKEIIISSWRELVKRGMVIVYGFVIMPNHLHVIWELKEPNGKEMPHASFNKFTSHKILSILKSCDALLMMKFKVNEQERWLFQTLCLCIFRVALRSYPKLPVCAR